MKLKEFADVICEPSSVYVYEVMGKALLKTTNTNIKNHDFVSDREVVKIEANNSAFYITVKR